MLCCLLALAVTRQAPAIDRDAYGVPHIHADSIQQAFNRAGYAVAQDRLWQLENSRRLARGRMAEVFGKQYVASDREVLLNGYTDEEIQRQIDALSPQTKEAFESYAKGVNAYIADATVHNSLPKGYADKGFKPEPWTPQDSAAIAIRLFQLFGRSSAGQLRDLALLNYLQNRPALKDRAFDVFDDLLWQNDSRSPVTVRPNEDPIAGSHYTFPALTRKVTEMHLAALPKVGLFEMLPGINLASRETSKMVAESVSVPYRTGSYAVALAPSRSTGGYPVLLSGPQMGFTEPSIVHEMSIETPGLNVVGMDVPGMPGIAIGYTPDVAWGLTTGVADVEDIVFVKASGADGYEYGGKVLPLQRIERTLKVKGEPDQKVVQLRTMHGPVVIKSSSGYYFARHAATWMHEMASTDALFNLYRAKTADQVESAMGAATMNFNFLYATRSGDIGYRYLGLIPERADGLDPRLPVPGEPRFEWKGIVPLSQLPHLRNPKDGLIFNWNNKPATWWANGDTPAWGRLFHSTVFESALSKPKLSTQDVEVAAWTAARTEPIFTAFKAWFPRDASWLRSYDGRAMDGSVGARVFVEWIGALRTELFAPKVGNLMSPDLFDAAIQPSVILNALEGKTKANYLAGRKASSVARDAYGKALASLSKRFGPNPNDWRYHPGGIKVDGQPPIPYINRGSYIQVVELMSSISGRNVLPPGIAETGAHSQDQVPLSRAWVYKPMTVFGP